MIDLKYPSPTTINLTGEALSFPAVEPDGRMRVVLANSGDNAMRISLDDATIEAIWKKMYEKPVIVICPACSSGNATTNTFCVMCGTPRGSGIWKPLCDL